MPDVLFFTIALSVIFIFLLVYLFEFIDKVIKRWKENTYTEDGDMEMDED